MTPNNPPKLTNICKKIYIATPRQIYLPLIVLLLDDIFNIDFNNKANIINIIVVTINPISLKEAHFFL